MGQDNKNDREPESMHFQPTWNVTTIVSVVTLFAMVIGVGAMWQKLTSSDEVLAERIGLLRTDVSVLDIRTKDIPNYEYRIGQTEAQIMESRRRGDESAKELQTLRDVVATLNTNIELIRQSQDRIEQTLGAAARK